MRYAQFHEVPIGALFLCNGAPYVKRSTRTARAAVGHPAYNQSDVRWFYFRRDEQVGVLCRATAHAK